MLPTDYVPFAGTRYPHPAARGTYNIAEGMMNIVRTAAIAHGSFANNKSKELDRGRYGFKR